MNSSNTSKISQRVYVSISIPDRTQQQREEGKGVLVFSRQRDDGLR